MQERKDNDKKVIKITGIISILVYNLLCFFLLFKVATTRGNELHPIAYIMLITMMILSDVCLVFVYDKIKKALRKQEISEGFVKTKLSSDKYVEVMPISASVPSRYYTFIKSELPSIAKFFAILDKEGNGVRIEIKFNDHEEYHFFEYVYTESFSSNYEIKE